jgi:outer membrane lipoprotein SlyB
MISLRGKEVKMKTEKLFVAGLVLIFFLACADKRYNTQKGSAIGAGVGAAIGQAIGEDTESTLIGTAVGLLVGAVAGNAVDQHYEAMREAARTNKKVEYHDDKGRTVEAIPGPVNKKRTECRKVTSRIWDNGKMVKETVEEICSGKKLTDDY